MLNNLKEGDILELKVKANSSKSEIIFENNVVNVFLKSIPEDNKANDELIKLFKKQLKLKVEIICGFKSKNKKIIIS